MDSDKGDHENYLGLKTIRTISSDIHSLLAVQKLVYSLLIIVQSVIGCFVPIIFKRLKLSLDWLCYLHAFSGGVLFAIGLVHLLPDAQESAEEAVDSSFPSSFALAAAGFYFSFAVQKTFFKSQTPIDTESRSADEKSNTKMSSTKPQTKDTGAQTASNDIGGTIVTVIAVLMISVHVILLGISMGSAGSRATVTNLFIAISSHKILVSISLSIQVLLYETSRIRTILMLGIFCAVMPVGIFIGLLLDETDPAVEFVFLSLASGTLIYLGTVDVIEVFETHPEYSRFAKVIDPPPQEKSCAAHKSIGSEFGISGCSHDSDMPSSTRLIEDSTSGSKEIPLQRRVLLTACMLVGAIGISLSALAE